MRAATKDGSTVRVSKASGEQTACAKVEEESFTLCTLPLELAKQKLRVIKKSEHLKIRKTKLSHTRRQLAYIDVVDWQRSSNS